MDAQLTQQAKHDADFLLALVRMKGIAPPPGAMPKGTRAEKINGEPGDAHRDGEQGTIYGVMPALDRDEILPNGHLARAGTFAYFIVWDSHPDLPVAITNTRVREVRRN